MIAGASVGTRVCEAEGVVDVACDAVLVVMFFFLQRSVEDVTKDTSLCIYIYLEFECVWDM